MIIALCLTVALCTAMVCAAIFWGGYALGKGNKAHTPNIQTADTARQEREARIKQLQMQNFWSYNGDQQQDPERELF